MADRTFAVWYASQGTFNDVPCYALRDFIREATVGEGEFPYPNTEGWYYATSIEPSNPTGPFTNGDAAVQAARAELKGEL